MILWTSDDVYYVSEHRGSYGNSEELERHCFYPNQIFVCFRFL